LSSNKKIYAPVIAYGGMCRAEYSMSLSALYVKTLQERPDISFFSTGILFESLVSRARNSAAAAALHYKCDYLLFIDADVAFDASDVFKLIDKGFHFNVENDWYERTWMVATKDGAETSKEVYKKRGDGWKVIMYGNDGEIFFEQEVDGIK